MLGDHLFYGKFAIEMPFTLEQFVSLRPYAYHLTSADNLDSIRDAECLESTTSSINKGWSMRVAEATPSQKLSDQFKRKEHSASKPMASERWKHRLQRELGPCKVGRVFKRSGVFLAGNKRRTYQKWQEPLQESVLGKVETDGD
jgi:hypothetical protein